MCTALRPGTELTSVLPVVANAAMDGVATRVEAAASAMTVRRFTGDPPAGAHIDVRRSPLSPSGRAIPAGRVAAACSGRAFGSPAAGHLQRGNRPPLRAARAAGRERQQPLRPPDSSAGRSPALLSLLALLAFALPTRARHPHPTADLLQHLARFEEAVDQLVDLHHRRTGAVRDPQAS